MLASEAGWATTDVQEVGSQPDFRVTFARMATRLLREMSRRHRIKDRAERALGVVKAFSIAVPSGVQLKLDVEAASGIADSGDHEQDLTDLLREIGEVAQTTGAGALFLIEEMHNLLMSNGRAHSGGLTFGRQSRKAPVWVPVPPVSSRAGRARGLNDEATIGADGPTGNGGLIWPHLRPATSDGA